MRHKVNRSSQLDLGWCLINRRRLGCSVRLALSPLAHDRPATHPSTLAVTMRHSMLTLALVRAAVWPRERAVACWSKVRNSKLEGSQSMRLLSSPGSALGLARARWAFGEAWRANRALPQPRADATCTGAAAMDHAHLYIAIVHPPVGILELAAHRLAASHLAHGA